MLDQFLTHYVPDAPCAPDAATISRYADHVPAEITDLWRQYGFTTFNRGQLRLINPDTYADALAQWLGKRVAHYVPIMLSGFGELFYYRRLTAEADDVCILDPHYRSIDTCSWSFGEYLVEYLLADYVKNEVLRQPLFADAVATHGPLTADEIFTFAPALVLGGAEDLRYVVKAHAPTHLDLLFQLGQ